MEFNSNWNYKECLEKISDIKKIYEGIMLSFSIFKNNKDFYKEAYDIKNKIYSLNFAEYDYWKKDKLWEYLNNDIEYVELCKFI